MALSPEARENKNRRRRERYAADLSRRELSREKSRVYYEKNQGRLKQKFNKAYRSKPEIYWERRILIKFGITKADYDRLLEAQGGVCAICRGTQVNRRKRLDVDHCHKTGRVRGLLCGFCNRALGMLKDNPELFLRVVTYLSKPGEVISGLKALQQKELV